MFHFGAYWTLRLQTFTDQVGCRTTGGGGNQGLGQERRGNDNWDLEWSFLGCDSNKKIIIRQPTNLMNLYFSGKDLPKQFSIRWMFFCRLSHCPWFFYVLSVKSWLSAHTTYIYIYWITNWSRRREQVQTRLNDWSQTSKCGRSLIINESVQMRSVLSAIPRNPCLCSSWMAGWTDWYDRVWERFVGATYKPEADGAGIVGTSPSMRDYRRLFLFICSWCARTLYKLIDFSFHQN